MGIPQLGVTKERTMKRIALVLCTIALLANGKPKPSADAKPKPEADAEAEAEGGADSEGSLGLYLVSLPSGSLSSLVPDQAVGELIPVDLDQILANKNRNIPSGNFPNDPRSYPSGYNQQELQQSFNSQRDQSNFGRNRVDQRQFPFSNNQESNFGFSTPPVKDQQSSRAKVLVLGLTNPIPDAFNNQQGQNAGGNHFDSFNNHQGQNAGRNPFDSYNNQQGQNAGRNPYDSSKIQQAQNAGINQFNSFDNHQGQYAGGNPFDSFQNQQEINAGINPFNAYKRQQEQIAGENSFNFRTGSFDNDVQGNNKNFDSIANLGFTNPIPDAFKNQQGQNAGGNPFNPKPSPYNGNEQVNPQNFDSSRNLNSNPGPFKQEFKFSFGSQISETKPRTFDKTTKSQIPTSFKPAVNKDKQNQNKENQETFLTGKQFQRFHANPASN